MPHLERAVTSRATELGLQHPDTISSQRMLATALEKSGQRSRAESLLREMRAALSERFGMDDPQTLETTHQLVIALVNQETQEKLEEAAAESAQCFELSRRRLGPDADATLEAAKVRIRLLRRLSRFEEADDLAEETIGRLSRVSGQDHPLTIEVTHERAMVLGQLGRLDEAESLLGQVLKARTDVGAPPRSILEVQHNIAVVKGHRGQFREAAELFEAIVATRRILLGDHHLDTVKAMWQLGRAQFDLRAHAEAEKTWREVVDLLRADRIADPSGCVIAYVVLGDLGALLARENRYAEAEELLEESIQALEREAGLYDSDTQNAVVAIIQLYDAWEGHGARAAHYREKLAPQSAGPR